MEKVKLICEEIEKNKIIELDFSNKCLFILKKNKFH
jgi:hypothetical protein